MGTISMEEQSPDKTYLERYRASRRRREELVTDSKEVFLDDDTTSIREVLTKSVKTSERTMLRIVHENWGLGVEEVWYIFGDLYKSRQFLVPLKQLSKAVDWQQGLRLLKEARSQRQEDNSNDPGWTFADAQNAVLLVGSSTLTRSDRPRSESSRGSNSGHDWGDDCVSFVDLDVDSDAAFSPTRIRCDASPRRVDSQKSVVSDAVAYAPCLSGADYTLRKHVEHQQSAAPRTTGQSQTEVADYQDLQAVRDRLTKHEMINDVCINVLLSAFNPDVTLWYVADTHLIAVDHSRGTTTKKLRIQDSQRKMIVPIHHPTLGHWNLGVIDRDSGTCAIFDSLPTRVYCDAAFAALQRFVRTFELLEQTISPDLDPVPGLRQQNCVDCGIYVIASALANLHDVSLDNIDPTLWRRHLAMFFGAEDSPLDGPALLEASSNDSVVVHESDRSDVSSAIKVIESLKTSITTADTRLTQCEFAAKRAGQQRKMLLTQKKARQKLLRLQEWCSKVPQGVDLDVKHAVKNQLLVATNKLNSVPKADESTLRSLGLLEHCADADASYYSTLISAVERHKQDLLFRTKARHKQIGLRLDSL